MNAQWAAHSGTLLPTRLLLFFLSLSNILYRLHHCLRVQLEDCAPDHRWARQDMFV